MKPVCDIARGLGRRMASFSRLVRLNYLTPDIMAAIVDGTHPHSATADRTRPSDRLGPAAAAVGISSEAGARTCPDAGYCILNPEHLLGWFPVRFARKMLVSRPHPSPLLAEFNSYPCQIYSNYFLY